MKTPQKSSRWLYLRDEWFLQSHLAKMELEDKILKFRRKYRRRSPIFRKLIRWAMLEEPIRFQKIRFK